MIPARRFPLGEKLVWLLIRTSLQKHFDRIFLRIDTTQQAEHCVQPSIMCANHSSWWDGYVAALVKKHLKLDGYLMMEEQQLRRYFFFTWIGCFSVNRHSARSAVQSLQYAARLLKGRPKSMVWMFPQGEIAPNDYRPLIFFSGAAHLAQLAHPVLVYPVAIRIEYLAEQRPDLFISMGAPLRLSEEELQAQGYLKRYTQQLEECITEELDKLRKDVVAQDFASFQQIMRGRASTNRIFDTFLLRKQIDRQVGQ